MEVPKVSLPMPGIAVVRGASQQERRETAISLATDMAATMDTPITVIDLESGSPPEILGVAHPEDQQEGDAARTSTAVSMSDLKNYEQIFGDKGFTGGTQKIVHDKRKRYIQ